MNTQKQILNDLLLELGAARNRLARLRCNSTPYGRHNGNNSFDTPERCEQEIEALEAELEKLQNPEPEKPTLKAEVQELFRKLDAVRVSGNTIQVIEPEPEQENVPEIIKDVDGVGTVTASYYENGVNEYIKFESEKGNALYCANLQSWAVIRDELPMTHKESILKVFLNEFNRLGPAPQPDPPKPELQIVNPDEFNFWKECIEKFLRSFKNNGRLRTSWKSGDTCYKKFNRRYNQIWNIPGYQDQLAAMQDLAAEMFLNRTPDLNLQVLEHGITSEQLEQAKQDIIRFYK